MDQQIASRLRADLFLRHAPGVDDSRERDDMLFAYLSDSNSVNVMPGSPTVERVVLVGLLADLAVDLRVLPRRCGPVDVYREEAERLEHRRT